jgi:translocator protein
MKIEPITPPMNPFIRLAIAVIPVIAASALGSYATMPAIPIWYAGLVKPVFSPPNWVFGPVWTLLYAIMAYAAWRIISLPVKTPGRWGAMTIFFVQLALNTAWSFVFFGNRNILGGLIVIALLWLTIAETIRRFAEIDKPAALLLVPYLAWVSFASLLNAALWQLNS